VETAFSLEDRVGIGLGPIVVNGLYPEVAGLDADPVAAAEFRQARMALQDSQVERLRSHLPLPQLRLPFLFTTDVGPRELDVLARALLAEIDALSGLPA
jgi:hypothetical protein